MSLWNADCSSNSVARRSPRSSESTTGGVGVISHDLLDDLDDAAQRLVLGGCQPGQRGQLGDQANELVVRRRPLYPVGVVRPGGDLGGPRVPQMVRMVVTMNAARSRGLCPYPGAVIVPVAMRSALVMPGCCCFRSSSMSHSPNTA